MSNPRLYFLTHVAMGAFIAFGAPLSLILFGPEHLPINHTLAWVIALLSVPFMMSISLAAIMIMQYAPNPMPMGPSLLAGFGILNLGFLISPILFVPGLVWLWVLPFDHEGHFNPSTPLSLDLDAIEEPHHD